MKAFLIFPFFYLKEVVDGALKIARDVLFPKQNLEPVLLRIPIDLSSARQRLILACLISMTPGTLSVAEEDNGRTLIVHSLYGARNPDEIINHIKNRYETIVARIPI